MPFNYDTEMVVAIYIILLYVEVVTLKIGMG